jgi:hypothetical protein
MNRKKNSPNEATRLHFFGEETNKQPLKTSKYASEREREGASLRTVAQRTAVEWMKGSVRGCGVFCLAVGGKGGNGRAGGAGRIQKPGF